MKTISPFRSVCVFLVVVLGVAGVCAAQGLEDEDLATLLELAEGGDAEAMFEVGYRYDIGQGVEEDNAAAVRWYRKAADLGNRDAMYSLGIRYAVGSGVEKDDVEALRWYRQAADSGDSDAMYSLALMYEYEGPACRDAGQQCHDRRLDMFDRFQAHFRKDTGLSCVEGRDAVEQLGDLSPKELLLQFGGESFNNGLYRVMAASVFKSAEGFIAQSFPDFADRAQGFAYDWLGRVFALDLARSVSGMHAVVMLEPGTGQALEIPCNLQTFHEDELINYSEEALAAGFYEQWLGGGGAPNYSQCIGYKRPLFLGGTDTIENLDLCDLDVYWALSAQMIEKTRDLPPGTSITNISLND